MGRSYLRASKLNLEDESTGEAGRMQLLNTSARGKIGRGATPSETVLPLLPSQEELLAPRRVQTLLRRHVQPSPDPQFPGRKQAATLGACSASWPRGGTPTPHPTPAPGHLAAPLQRQLPTRVAAAMLTSDPKPAGKGPRGRSGPGGARGKKYSPEEVVFAVELAFPGEALRSGCIYIHSTGRT